MSPTKQARGDSGKERKLHRWQNGEKTLGETRLSRGASSPPARRISSLFQLQQSQSVSGPLLPGVFPRWLSRWRGPHWRSVSGAHLCVLDSADGQGCRGCLQVLILHLWQTLVKSVKSLMVGFLWGPRRGCHRLFSGVRSSQSFKGWIQTEACVIPSYHGMLIPWQKHRNSKTISVAVVPSRNNPDEIISITQAKA